MTQFEYFDSPPVKTAKKGSRAYWATFQTGLSFVNGTPKPAYQAYAFPIWVHQGYNSSGTGEVELWAQVRYRRFASPSDAVEFLFQPKGSTTWTPVTGQISIQATQGFVDVVVPSAPYAPGGTFIGVWAGPAPPYFATTRQVSFP
jgi:hypothetical protein